MDKGDLRRRLIIATTKSLNDMGYSLTYRYTLFQPGVEITMSRPKEPKFSPLVFKGKTAPEVMADLALWALTNEEPDAET